MVTMTKPNDSIAEKHEDDAVALNIRNMPRHVRRSFRSWCVERDLKMESVTSRMIELLITGRLSEVERRIEILSKD